jgi:protease-4
MMETTYERFLQRVATGRKMERDAVHELAQGRVWTGAAAKDNGLVDELGGLDAAIAAAHELGGVAAGTELEVYPGTPTLRDLLGSLSQIQSQIQALAGVDGRLQELAQVAGPGPAAQVARILRLVTELRHTHIWAVSWVQAPR